MLALLGFFSILICLQCKYMNLASCSERSFGYFLRTYELFTYSTIIVFTTIFQLIGLCFTLLQCFACPFLQMINQAWNSHHFVFR